MRIKRIIENKNNRIIEASIHQIYIDVCGNFLKIYWKTRKFKSICVYMSFYWSNDILLRCKFFQVSAIDSVQSQQ